MIQRVNAQHFQWERTIEADALAQELVQRIISDVRAHGDSAVIDYTASFDTPRAKELNFALQVPEVELRKAWEELDEGLQDALRAAAARIRHFHELQLPSGLDYTDADGARLGMTWRPVRRAGVYAPGGRAAYPSTVLMNTIPAQVAGVPEIALMSPPQRDTGLPHPLVMAAAHLVGVSKVYRAGGAQAIAALAYGTESVPRVDKVVGPGNLYVALAKRYVMGDVGIDSIAGPSEVFIVADASANPAYIAADMLAQAEHDIEAGAVCVVTDAGLADAVQDALREQLQTLPRREVAEEALSRYGAIVTASSLDEAVAIVNQCAPEHVELMMESPEIWLTQIQTAGAAFLGPSTPEPVGDYYAGTNHVLPTHGTARFASGLGVADFLRRMTYVSYEGETLARHAGHVTALARAEGLDGHARAVEIRTSAKTTADAINEASVATSAVNERSGGDDR